MNTSLRRVDFEADRDLLRRIYAESRDDVALLVDWSDVQKQAFCDAQFDAQDRDYRGRFADADYHVIRCDGEDVGRLYVDRRHDEIRVLDVALLRAWRRRGLGRHWMQTLLDEARRAGLPVRIHVEQNNPALALYESLGFERRGEVGVYWFMERMPPGD